MERRGLRQPLRDRLANVGEQPDARQQHPHRVPRQGQEYRKNIAERM